MHQLSLRGFDPELERRLRELARTEGISLNRAALRLLRRGAGLEGERASGPAIGPAMDRFIGTWSAAEARGLERALEIFETVDPELWR